MIRKFEILLIMVMAFLCSCAFAACDSSDIGDILSGGNKPTIESPDFGKNPMQLYTDSMDSIKKFKNCKTDIGVEIGEKTAWENMYILFCTRWKIPTKNSIILFFPR